LVTFFFSSRRRHTRSKRDWSSDVCSSDLDNRGRIKEYIDAHSDAEYFEGSLWDHDIKADIALPCATQNEINEEQAQRLVDNGIKFVAEGANMPSHTNAVKVYKENKLRSE